MFDALLHESWCPFYRVPHQGNSREAPVNAELLYDRNVAFSDKTNRTLCVTLT